MSTDFSALSTCRTAALIRCGKIDARELLEFHLDKIRKLNGDIKALRYIDEASAKKKVEELHSDLKRGLWRGRLHGILFTAKDTVPIAGMPRSDGSKEGLLDNVAKNSALAAKIFSEGAVCIGKTNMAEYGKSYYTDNPLFGRTFNPFDLKRSPGGSGGGDSAALAADFAQFGLGADAGGSVRVPANFCGLFGLFPTRGLFSDAGLSSITHTFAKLFRCAGVVAKSIDDIDLLYSILKGYDPLDPASVSDMPWRSFSSAKGAKEFAYYTQINGVNCDSEIKASLLETVKKLESLGFRGTEHTPPALGGAYEIFIVLAGQASLILEDLLAVEGGKPRKLEEEGANMKTLRSRIASELPKLTVESLLKCFYLVDRLRNEILGTFDKYQFILSPVSATLPPLYDTALYEIDGQKLQSQQVFQYSSAVNVLGLPAVAFPTNFSKSGLPIGLQIVGPRFSEKELISVIRDSGLDSRLRLSEKPRSAS